MTMLTPYLSFNGNCKEAMAFYQSCLGGKLDLMQVAGSPMEKDMPEKKDQVLHAMLKSKDLILMASDLLMGGEAKHGNDVTLCISGGGLKELEEYFTKLSEGGEVTHKLEETFFGFYGDLTDKYGFHWAFQADKEEK